MSPRRVDPAGVGLWAAAVVGAVIVLVGPMTSWVLGAEIVGLTLCLTATAALAILVVRR